MQNKTMYYKSVSSRTASLLIVDKTKKARYIPLNGSCTLGRDYPFSDCNIRIDSDIIGRNHGEFIYDDNYGDYYYIDNNSTNGTYLNGEKLKPYNENGSKAVKLNDGDILRIDNKSLHAPHPDAVLIVYSTSLKSNDKWSELLLDDKSEISIGRDSKCNLYINSIMVSRLHAVLSKKNGKWFMTDKKSTNGVGINGRELVKESEIFDHDVIRIADTTIIFLGDRLLYNESDRNSVSLYVDIKQKTVNLGKKTLIKDIRAEFENGDFVLILGSSGAGKTTMVRSILGECKADGNIILNGEDLYKNFKKVKSQIGLVPQFLTLRKNDTVKHTLLDTAGIRMGKGYTKEDRNKRVEEILEHVGIKEHEDKLICELSGGQQKKASVANQLVGFQRVFICDEPDSGLDGASRMQQMAILKDISRENKIVMVITHEPDDAVEIKDGKAEYLFTKVIVLARSSSDHAGHLAYFGDPVGALKYFNVNRLQDIMLEINSPAEGGRGHADYFIRKFEDSERKDNNA